MRLLLDTNALIWCFGQDEKLSASARKTIGDRDNEILVSIVSLWELAIKSATGKFTGAIDLENHLQPTGYGLLPVTLEHVKELRELPLIHRDPFDRMLIAQAKIENLVIVTADRRFAEYDIGVMPA